MQSQHENKLHLLDSVLSFIETLEKHADAIDNIKCVIKDLEEEDA